MDVPELPAGAFDFPMPAEDGYMPEDFMIPPMEDLPPVEATEEVINNDNAMFMIKYTMFSSLVFLSFSQFCSSPLPLPSSSVSATAKRRPS